MRDFVFVHPTFSYDSYTDYRRLVEVAGFETCNQDQMNPNRNCTYVVSPMNGDVEAAIRARPKDKRQCKIIHWFLERPSPYGGAQFKDRVKQMLAEMVDEFWLADKAMHAVVSDVSGTKFVPVGGDEALGSRGSAEKVYDMCHMSYVYGRRETVMNRVRCRIGPNGWGQSRHNTLLRTKLMLNVHQDDDLYYEPLRFALCAAYAMPMISETCSDSFPYEQGTDFLSAPLGGLNDLLDKILKEGPEKYKVFGERMFEKATRKFRFVDNVKRMFK